eukprot:3194065-Prymnesium_polylepis.1
MSRGLTANEIHVIFNEFDSSKDKKLDWHEVKAAMSFLGMELRTTDLTRIIQHFDADHSGYVDLDEFCA